MEEKKREILNQVRTGTITAEEGAARLDALAAEAEAPAATATAAPRHGDISAPIAPVARSVKVVSQFGSAEIVADPSVAVAVAEGPHRARVDGDTLILEHMPFQDEDTFTFGLAGRKIEINGFDFKTRRSMKVRMNPDLPLAANVQAGNVRVEGVHGPITAEVQAGNCQLNDFRSPFDVLVQAGSVTASGRLNAGTSRVRCEMGSVRINLDKGSSVKITARTTLGKVSVDDAGGERAVAGPGGKDVTIGAGAATLDVECTMGNVRLSAQ